MRRVLLIVVLLAGCRTPQSQQGMASRLAPVVTVDPLPPTMEWRRIATDADQSAIDALRRHWNSALDGAAGRHVSRLRAEGPLLDPAAAQPLPALPPGPYHCRLVRLGGRAGYATYKPDICYVDGDEERQSFTKQDGTSLPGGWLYADNDSKRLVFLGTNRLRRDEAAPGYGVLPGREVAGVVERVAPFRWRLVLTRPLSNAAEIELYELTPFPPPPAAIASPQPASAPLTGRRSRGSKNRPRTLAVR